MLVYVTSGELRSGQVWTYYLRRGHEDELQFEAEVDDIKRQVYAIVQRLTSPHSPCQLHESLVSLLKALASTSDENKHCKSL
jgi:hypothetical protein